ncbi:hypothetical protein HDU96_002526 [Phlyctochytrium bullatum]|nr:hypothetical protein HDU96_002526 [Phlyctochytrium bullatum]
MDLKHWPEKEGPKFSAAALDEKKLQISGDIAKGLAFINGLGIFHNDLKPQNVFMDKYHKPYIGDFGVATNRGEPLLGYTVQYFDKESRQLIPDELSDSWLLGATLWEFWADEAFNVKDNIFFDDIGNRTMRDILKKLLRPRARRSITINILSLFNSTTRRTAYMTVEARNLNPPQENRTPPSQQSSLRSVDSAATLMEQRSLSARSVAYTPSPPPLVDPLKQCWNALVAGDIDSFKSILLAKLVDVNSTKDGLTSLHVVCRKNILEAVKMLLEIGADPQQKDADGNLPIQLSTSLDVWRALAAKMPAPSGDLFDAAKRGDDVSARLILAVQEDPKASVNELRWVELNGWRIETVMPLHAAAWYGHAPVCEVLLHAGAEVDGRDEGEKTPLMQAAHWEHLSVAQVLVERGANVHARDEKGMTPLHYAAWNGHVDMARFLLDRGADVNCRDKWERTPLMRAASEGHLPVAQVLVERGADVHARDKGERTPLILAAPKGHLPVAQVLVERGADVNARDKDGTTTLHWAAYNGHVDMARFLLDRGADVNCRNYRKETPLMEAAKWGRLNVAQLLVEKGADVHARDEFGKTARDYALTLNRKDVAEFLAPLTLPNK